MANLYILKTSNISYLRNHLSEVLSYVREGEAVTVLDRQKPIARLIPYTSEDDTLTRRVRDLQQSGLLEHHPGDKSTPLPTPIQLKKAIDVSQMIVEERNRQ